MMHTNRVWCVAQVETAEELAEKLTQYSWCCCTGFELNGFVWLNDATSPDGAQEFAACRLPTDDDPNYRQVESITASWCTEVQMLRYILDVQNGTMSTSTDTGPMLRARSATEFFSALGGTLERPAGNIVHPTIETPEQHERCHHCA